MTNYQSAVQRINNANTQAKLERLERSLENLYNLGCFTGVEFASLDEKLLDKLVFLAKQSEG
jgi:hypothetical protein